MAKKFKFRLEGLLKVREFSEKNLKIELGQLLKEAQKVRERIQKLQDDLEEGHQSQEAITKQGTDSEMLKFYPRFIQAKGEDIQNQENLLRSLERKIEKKRDELSLARGNVKMIENLKEKEKTSFKKEQEKKQQMDIEDILQMRRMPKDGQKK